jgi:hypothetical protein
MTHTLHREGNLENLREDFVVFTMSAKTVNKKGSDKKMRKFFDIVEKYNPVNYGDMKTGNKYNSERDVIYRNIQDTSIVHFVFTDKEIVGRVIEELKEADLGTSVVVSGLVETTDDLCKQAGLRMHTVEFSGGIHGRLDLLPEKQVLEITTMCGHGMVASHLVEDMVKKIKKGKKSLEEASVELSKPCQCGIFNHKRAEDLIRRFL